MEPILTDPGFFEARAKDEREKIAALIKAGDEFVAERCECKGAGKTINSWDSTGNYVGRVGQPCEHCMAWQTARKDLDK